MCRPDSPEFSVLYDGVTDRLPLNSKISQIPLALYG
jgi:hypothetical protein